VLGTGAAQRELLPALMAAYAHADHVVGLDVDRDQVGDGGLGWAVRGRYPWPQRRLARPPRR
jgi:hypothetical protein